MPTIYHRDQAGAPDLPYATNQSVGHTTFFTLLKACLVEGYSGKPAAGWELIFEAANTLCLRNGSHTGYVTFVRISNSQTNIYLSQTYTGNDGTYITGDGLRTGNAANSAVPQRLQLGYAFYYSAPTSWTMIADDKSFILSMSGGGSGSSNSINRSYRNGDIRLYVGEDSEGNFIAVGGDNTTSSPQAYFHKDGMTILKDPATGFLLDASATSPRLPGTLTLNFAEINAGVLPYIHLTPLIWTTNNVYGGKLRGVLLCPWLMNCFPNEVAKSLGRTTDFYTRDSNTPFDLGDGHSYFVTSGFPTVLIISDNPEYW